MIVGIIFFNDLKLTYFKIPPQQFHILYLFVHVMIKDSFKRVNQRVEYCR